MLPRPATRLPRPLHGPLIAALLGGGIAGLTLALAMRRTERRFAAEGAAPGGESRSAAPASERDLEKLVEERTGELSALSTHLQELAEKEKTELARNLHDELGGLLTAAKMDLSWLQGRMTAEPAVQQRLQQLGSVLDEAMDVKRRVVEDLRPSLLDHFGLPTALRAYVESVSAGSRLACEFEASGEEDFPKDIAIGLFRVVQEGLANVVRHAGARRVRLELASDVRAYSLKLVDDGRGIDLASPDFRWSHGITGMRHRVRALGGSLSLESSPGRGTALSVEVPKRDAAARQSPSTPPSTGAPPSTGTEPSTGTQPSAGTERSYGTRPSTGAQPPAGADHLERPSATMGFKRPMSRILSRK